MKNESSNRRSFFHKIVRFGALGGIASLLLGRLGEKTVIPPAQAVTYMVIDGLNSGGGQTALVSYEPGFPAFYVENSSGTNFSTAIYGDATATSGSTSGTAGFSASPSGIGVFGKTTATTGENYGVYGESNSPGGVGVVGYNSALTGYCVGVTGISNSVTGAGVHGRATSSGIGMLAATTATTGTPLVARGTTGQSANLQEWQIGPLIGSQDIKSVVNKDGWLGIGTNSPVTRVHTTAAAANMPAAFFDNSGSGDAQAIQGRITGTSGRAFVGFASATSGNTIALDGVCNSTSGIALRGANTGTTGDAIGVQGQTESSTGACIIAKGPGAAEVFRVQGNGNINIKNTAGAPTSSTGGGVLFVENGALKFRGSSGTVTTIAPA